MHETPTLCCALALEERAARRTGLPVARVGIGATLPLPEGPLISFGLCGALVDDLPPGTLVVADRVVDEEGEALWEGEPLDVAGARVVTVCGAPRVVDQPAERADMRARTDAAVVDLESGILARRGRLVGVVRAVSDGPGHRLGRLSRGARQNGSVRWTSMVRALVMEPTVAIPAALRAQDALRRLRSVRV